MDGVEQDSTPQNVSPTAVVHRNESVLKNIFKRGYEEIRDRKLLGILKKDRTWLKYVLAGSRHISVIINETKDVYRIRPL
jgi:hypothetical protein